MMSSQKAVLRFSAFAFGILLFQRPKLSLFRNTTINFLIPLANSLASVATRIASFFTKHR
jgi:hypothetical protein